MGAKWRGPMACVLRAAPSARTFTRTSALDMMEHGGHSAADVVPADRACSIPDRSRESRAPAGLERAIAFPMAVVPNLWGIWNALYLALGSRGRISIGIFGA
jgi:hypothetical protein